jgi:hypothetical protein
MFNVFRKIFTQSVHLGARITPSSSVKSGSGAKIISVIEKIEDK